MTARNVTIYTAGSGRLNGMQFNDPSEARTWLRSQGWVERLPRQPTEFYNPITGSFASMRAGDSIL